MCVHVLRFYALSGDSSVCLAIHCSTFCMFYVLVGNCGMHKRFYLKTSKLYYNN